MRPTQPSVANDCLAVRDGCPGNGAGRWDGQQPCGSRLLQLPGSLPVPFGENGGAGTGSAESTPSPETAAGF